ncbi:tetraacyldisaccharide 4'-kinase [Bosea psychrotolerans]|uniref:Tetraacyldisaccharide 4'-kinase n=1 Tax=Bosea psychrotolerans TaxID=1871628 RepID=A0A2S4M4J6_9HYPH|nr:tetraacyldisaccharide 4'-kinase [Bosea psychrotolerans]POR49624.1 lipid-A-disaccharide kinase [Bosea psychrotolerans]
MRSPEFWWRPRPGAPARLLQPFGWLYGAITRLRMCRRGANAGIPVICVGNFVAGGAGKTPTAIALAALLRSLGETPFMLTRGYGGALAGPIEVEPRHGPHDVGDEALLLAAQARTIVARERAAGAGLAKRLGASVIVMDDGLQNPSLAKDLRIAVVDGASGVGNGLCVPAGPLRAPLAGQFAATDAILMIGDGAAGDAVALAAQMAGLELLRARLEPSRETASRLEGHPVIAVSGIGRPEKFAATLLAAKAKILSQRAFGDHHPYSAHDVSSLIAEARRLGCLIATTEKDMTKLGPLWPETERERLVVVPVALVFEDTARLAGLVRSVLASAAAGAAQP